MIVSVRPASIGGAYRDRHGRGKREVMDALARETNAPMRTAKACGPDPPMLGSSLAGRSAGRWWLKSTAHQGERAISRKTIAQGTPVVPAALLLPGVRNAQLSLHARLTGAASIRCSLRPLKFRRGSLGKARA